MSAGRAPCRLTYIAADDAEGQARLAAFTQALSQLGWSEGRNLRIDTCWATAGDVHRHAAELVALAPDVLLAATGMIWRFHSGTAVPRLAWTYNFTNFPECSQRRSRFFRPERDSGICADRIEQQEQAL